MMMMMMIHRFIGFVSAGAVRRRCRLYPIRGWPAWLGFCFCSSSPSSVVKLFFYCYGNHQVQQQVSYLCETARCGWKLGKDVQNSIQFNTRASTNKLFFRKLAPYCGSSYPGQLSPVDQGQRVRSGYDGSVVFGLKAEKKVVQEFPCHLCAMRQVFSQCFFGYFFNHRMTKFFELTFSFYSGFVGWGKFWSCRSSQSSAMKN